MGDGDVIFITGAARGIGRDLVELFLRKGFRVVAGTRVAEDAEKLQSEINHPNLIAIPCDVTNETAITQALDRILSDFGRLDVVVNNAGYGQFGAVEIVPLEKVRAQMETNYFGLVNMCQKVLPIMRKQGRGKIINVSSVAGRFSFPTIGFYCASKYAVEGITEALYHEVKPFGIHAVLVEPGKFATSFSETRRKYELLDSEGGPYFAMQQRLKNEDYKYRGANPKRVARLILRIVKKRNPRLRYVVGLDGHAMVWLGRILPTFLYDAIMQFAIHRRWK